MKALTCNRWAKPSTCGDASLLLQRLWGEKRHPSFPFVLGLDYFPDHLKISGDFCQTVRQSQLGTSLFLVLLPELCKVLTKDQGTGRWGLGTQPVRKKVLFIAKTLSEHRSPEARASKVCLTSSTSPCTQDKSCMYAFRFSQVTLVAVKGQGDQLSKWRRGEERVLERGKKAKKKIYCHNTSGCMCENS